MLLFKTAPGGETQVSDTLKAPFVYFGGKSAVADKVWSALGQPKSYLEPFFGSGAVLLARPDYQPGVHVESVVDADGFVANVWRGLQHDPDEVAKWCDWPVNHADLCARRRRLLANEARLLENLIANDEWFDAKLAGYWVWAASCWIGSGLTCPNARPHLGNGGKGVHALGQRPDENNNSLDVRAPYNPNLYAWFRRLSERLRYVRIVCGDWTRICGGNWQDGMGDVGIFFDPPYSDEKRDQEIYQHESQTVSHDVRAWAIERGKIESYRIVIAGYEGEHEELAEHGWTKETWSAQGGYANLGGADTPGKENRHREILWYSPHCQREKTLMPLFAAQK